MAAVASLSAVFVLIGCAPFGAPAGSEPGTADQSPSPTRVLAEQDVVALQHVEAAAISTAAKGDPATNRVECWVPSEHMVEAPASDTVFRILCRVHYRAEEVARYIDLTCIGDFALSPMLDHCYPWLPYSEVPTFEDAEAVWITPAGR